MASNDQRSMDDLRLPATTLQQLGRPFEAIAWQSVMLFYASRLMPQADSVKMQCELNEQRKKLLACWKPPTREFLCCEVGDKISVDTSQRVSNPPIDANADPLDPVNTPGKD